MSGFEGSYLGANDRISAAAVMECKICWTPYDPAEGDDYRQVMPGTAFADLPDDWHCPGCGAPAAQFMVLSDPGSAEVQMAAYIAGRTAALEADFREIWHAKMRDVPLVNAALQVQAIGFRASEGCVAGVLISPWFFNLVLLPLPGQDWSALQAGAKETIAFPSGEYEFIHNTREMVGGYKACALFSMMGDFANQLQAVEVARAVMAELYVGENRADTDQTAEIRALRQAEVDAQAEADLADAAPDVAPVAPTRRALITAGLAAGD
ncbi:MAG: [NiFe]-hydrogenase assembly chaperone HybE [Paracoccaceae bacterium]|nr:[NiFe]-hydrogenase assembly chaperone HybE [Paracoccaceae bacterium]